jgi:predicted acetyltransferase
MREGQKQFIIIYEEEGKPQGYFIYRASSTNEGRLKFGQNISINDMAWLTPSAFRAIWEFFSRMDLGLKISLNRAPSDDPLPHLLEEPRMLNRMTRDGILGRIVDIERAMDKRRYDAEGSLIFKITDNLCPWNEGTWKLEASPNGSTVKVTDESPQLEMPVSTLPVLFFGQLSATKAARMGRLDVIDSGSLKTWDAVMETRYAPACADMF